jgi:hypothetical protein
MHVGQAQIKALLRTKPAIPTPPQRESPAKKARQAPIHIDLCSEVAHAPAAVEGPVDSADDNEEDEEGDEEEELSAE